MSLRCFLPVRCQAGPDGRGGGKGGKLKIRREMGGGEPKPCRLTPPRAAPFLGRRIMVFLVYTAGIHFRPGRGGQHRTATITFTRIFRGQGDKSGSRLKRNTLSSIESRFTGRRGGGVKFSGNFVLFPDFFPQILLLFLFFSFSFSLSTLKHRERRRVFSSFSKNRKNRGKGDRRGQVLA